MKSWYGVLVLFFFLNLEAGGESFRTLVAGNLEISLNNPAGASLSLFCNNAALISLGADIRFCVDSLKTVASDRISAYVRCLKSTQIRAVV
jgi:hypothetical protein